MEALGIVDTAVAALDVEGPGPACKPVTKLAWDLHDNLLEHTLRGLVAGFVLMLGSFEVAIAQAVSWDAAHYDGTVVNKHIGAVRFRDESETLLSDRTTW